MQIIDFHTHIFPDKIAHQAIAALAEESGDYRPKTDGTLKGLLASMDTAGIAVSVVANIATRPTQMLPIFDFCRHLRGDRIVPLISFHPANTLTEVERLLTKAAALGIRGVKLHPMYQEFTIDDRRMFPYYQLIDHFGSFVVFHTGMDMAFPGNLQADVDRVRNIAVEFPGLTVVATHIGGWKQWDRVEQLGRLENVYTETSLSLTEMDDAEFVRLLSFFDEDRVLFGSDSPWSDQAEMIGRTMRLGISDARKEKLFRKNALSLLGRAGASRPEG